MCPGGVDVSFEGGKRPVEVRVSADKRVVRFYPDLGTVHREGEIRVKVVVRARDATAGGREVTVDGVAGVVGVDRASGGGGAGRKIAMTTAATSRTITKTPPTPVSPTSKPLSPPILSREAPTTTTITTTAAPPKPTITPTKKTSIPTAIFLALLSLFLTLLYPVIGGHRGCCWRIGDDVGGDSGGLVEFRAPCVGWGDVFGV
ncbi:hypothetical protein HDU67_007116 [Dinochytrium kinnereticum]|nr:hypothetical protein HDU67_007116 [Dinochytrium kinnereticum]